MIDWNDLLKTQTIMEKLAAGISSKEVNEKFKQCKEMITQNTTEYTKNLLITLETMADGAYQCLLGSFIIQEMNRTQDNIDKFVAEIKGGK